MRVLLAVTAALTLAACDQGQKTAATATGAAPCAPPVERIVGFTSPQAKDRLMVEALGPDCSNPALFARLFDPNGRLVYSDMTSGKWLMSVELFPPGGGTARGVAENLYDIGEPNSMNLPLWRAGQPKPERGNYGAYEALVPQPAYERLRALNATTLIKRGGGESGTFYIYDPEAGQAIAVAQFAV